MLIFSAQLFTRWYDFPLLLLGRYITALATTLPSLFLCNLFQYSIIIFQKKHKFEKGEISKGEKSFFTMATKV